jgi:hypothetical protein
LIWTNEIRRASAQAQQLAGSLVELPERLPQALLLVA